MEVANIVAYYDTKQRLWKVIQYKLQASRLFKKEIWAKKQNSFFLSQKNYFFLASLCLLKLLFNIEDKNVLPRVNLI